MKKYLQEVMANPEYKRTFEDNEIFAMLVTAMNAEVQSELEVVHFLCKQVKNLCNKLQGTEVSVFETDADPYSQMYKELLLKQLQKELYDYKVKFGRAPTTIFVGIDIQRILAEHIVVSNSGSIFQSNEKTLLGIPLTDGVEGTIDFAIGGRLV